LIAKPRQNVNSAAMAAPFYQSAPNQPSALADAVYWVGGILTGSVGTSLAILAIGGVGLAMLQGRLSARDGLRVVLGCFILFGAPAIAQGLAGISRSSSSSISIPTPAPPPKLTPPPTPERDADPYAGASMPM
jgi:type IV secretion system protein VirB2